MTNGKASQIALINNILQVRKTALDIAHACNDATLFDLAVHGKDDELIDGLAKHLPVSGPAEERRAKVAIGGFSIRAGLTRLLQLHCKNAHIDALDNLSKVVSVFPKLRNRPTIELMDLLDILAEEEDTDDERDGDKAAMAVSV